MSDFGRWYFDEVTVGGSRIRRTGPVGSALVGGGLSPPSFVVMPGGSVGGNVYENMSDCYDAMVQVTGPKTLHVDDSLGPVVMPPRNGGYNWDKVVFTGYKNPGLRSTVTIQDGVTWSAPPVFLDQISMVAETETTVCSIGAGLNLMTVGPTSQFYIDNASGIPFFRVLGGTLFILVEEGSLLGGGTSPGVVRVDGGNLSVYGFLQAAVAADAIEGNAGTVSYFLDPSAIVDVQSSLAIVPSFFYGDASQLAYVPANGANWVNPDPDTVAEAIDRLAARVVAMGGAPIP
jgi:hypothetical protein